MLPALTTIAITSTGPRHLVYHFDVRVTVAQGSSDGQYTDSGTITIDEVALQPDSGKVVRITETSGKHVVAAITCVTYGIGLVNCSPVQTVTVEEMTLLRLCGRDFLNWRSMDAQHKWSYSESDGHAREDDAFRVTNMRPGNVDVAFQRVLNIPGADGYVATTSGRLDYDDRTSIPANLTQDTVTHPQRALGRETTEHLTFTLQSDSLAQVPK